MGLVLIVVLGDMVEVESIVPSTFLNRKDYYFFSEFGDDGHLVTRLGPGDSGNRVFGLLVVIPHFSRFLSKFKQIYYINCYDSYKLFILKKIT